MRVMVDRDLCEANGICAALAPEVFDLDDEDYLHIAAPEVAGGRADAVRHAVASCPKQALRLEE
ncbi:MAG TPA: ferredoxin [Streptosporangiaceae bacterium]